MGAGSPQGPERGAAGWAQSVFNGEVGKMKSGDPHVRHKRGSCLRTDGVQATGGVEGGGQKRSGHWGRQGETRDGAQEEPTQGQGR